MTWEEALKLMRRDKHVRRPTWPSRVSLMVNAAGRLQFAVTATDNVDYVAAETCFAGRPVKIVYHFPERYGISADTTNADYEVVGTGL